MESQSERKTIYELAFVLKTGESDTELDSVLSANGATVLVKNPLTPIQLAFPIKKATSGQFGFYHLTVADPASIKEITHALHLRASVLRFLFTKVKKIKPVTPRERSVPAPVPEKKSVPSVSSGLDSLTNEKLEQTLEEILK